MNVVRASLVAASIGLTSMLPAQPRRVVDAPLDPQAALVNAPVAPEAIYVGAGGALPTLAVIDLNGFGQGTGVLARSNFANNPNLGRPDLFPPLAPGSDSLDAGGEGPFSLTRNTAGNPRLLEPPAIGGIDDLALGQPLDLVFNNENLNVFVLPANQTNPATQLPARGNTISVAPHPNPPRLILPPPNPMRGIFGEEPTVTSSGPPFVAGRVMTTSPPCWPSPRNLLLNGVFDGVFNGPQPPPPSPPPPIPYCPYTSRQQIGHFLYALDRHHGEVVVLNSNRCTVLDRIALPDATSLAMAPNLEVLAVSQRAPGTVSFVDVNPRSRSFHQVIAVTRVGNGASGLAWQPEGEDLLVCNTLDDSLSIVSGVDFNVRKTVRRFLRSPRDVAVTMRQVGVGFDTWTWFAYILNADGTVAVYESGPQIVGRDDIVDVVGPFLNARAIQPDLTAFSSACWIAHQQLVGGRLLGQISRLALTSSPRGPQPLVVDLEGTRGQVFGVTTRIGGANPTTPIHDLLSGSLPLDLAFDDVRNLGAYPDVRSVLLPGLRYAEHSGKGQAKIAGLSGLQPAVAPQFLFIAVGDVGNVDVFEIATGRRLTSLAVPGVQTLGHYWRQ